MNPFCFHSKIRMYAIVLCLFTGLLSPACFGQSDSIKGKQINNPVIYEMELDNGGIVKQKGLKNITYKNAYYQGIHLRIGWKQLGTNDKYNQLYNNPVYGVGFYSATLNKSSIGSPYALYGFIQVPLKHEQSSKWLYDYRIALGLSGDFNPFDKVNNPSNQVIGSENNVYISFGFRVQYKFHPNWRMGMGVSFHHFSNGALALPNKGINLIPLSLSLNYQPQKEIPVQRDVPIKPYSRKWMYDLHYGMGFKQLREDINKLYLKISLAFYASRHVSHKWRIGGGLDIFYAASGNKKEIAEDKAGRISSIFSGGPSFYLVHILNERLILNGNIGCYIHKQRFNGEVNRFFLRAGIRYYIYKNLNAGLSIKAHMGKADFIEWTLGYTINK